VREGEMEKGKRGRNGGEGERGRDGEREVAREGKKELGNIQRAMLMLFSSAGGHSLRFLCVRLALSPHFCCCSQVLLRACQQ
jgi:hypothetical protein